jgi:hypothetical protein
MDQGRAAEMAGSGKAFQNPFSILGLCHIFQPMQITVAFQEGFC